MKNWNLNTTNMDSMLDGNQTNRLRKRFDSTLRIWITMGCGSSVLSIQQMLRKYRRHRLRLLRKKEYNRLRAMVPSIATKPKVSKVTVIEEAIKYIDQLHAALVTRLQTRGLPQAFRGLGLGLPQDMQQISHSQIRELVRRMLPSNERRTTTHSVVRRCPSSSSHWPTVIQQQQLRGKWRSP